MQIKNKISFLNTGIGQKITMSLTGIFLCTFLIVHLIGNLQLFKNDAGQAFNEYAVFMTSFGPIKFVSYGLYAMIIYHAFKGLHLVYKNNKARPVKYKYENANANSHWTSRYMGVLGTIILVFIVTHMSDFWWKYHNDDTLPYTQYETNLSNGSMQALTFTGTIAGKKLEYITSDNSTKVVVVKDLYKIVASEFKEILPVILYILAMFAISFHLIHGFKSAFQSLGINHSKYNGLLNFIGVYVFGIAVPIGFAMMPIYFYFFK